MSEDPQAGSSERLPVRIEPLGDGALLITPTSSDPQEAWVTAQTCARTVDEAALPGVEGVVATYGAAMVEFDPLRLDPRQLTELIEYGRPAHPVRFLTGRVIEIPVAYGGEHGPDLDTVAAHLELTPEEVIQRHSAALWRVALNGTPAGAPMHEARAFDAPIPRLKSPRTKIPARSVALSGHQGIVYTVQSPGGWQLIGRTPLDLINISGEPFTVIEPGDQLRFRPITAAEYGAMPQVFIGHTPEFCADDGTAITHTGAGSRASTTPQAGPA